MSSEDALRPFLGIGLSIDEGSTKSEKRPCCVEAIWCGPGRQVTNGINECVGVSVVRRQDTALRDERTGSVKSEESDSESREAKRGEPAHTRRVRTGC